MKQIMTAVVLMVGLGLLTSCRTPSAGVVVETYPGSGPKITVNSKIVGSMLEVLEFNNAVRNGLLQVQITVQNTTQKDISFEYCFQWVSSTGMKVDSISENWTPLSLGGKEKSMINVMSPCKEAQDYIFKIRFVRPSTRS